MRQKALTPPANAAAAPTARHALMMTAYLCALTALKELTATSAGHVLRVAKVKTGEGQLDWGTKRSGWYAIDRV